MNAGDICVIDRVTANVYRDPVLPVKLEIVYGVGATPFGAACFIAETGGRICWMAFVSPGEESLQITALAKSWPGAVLRRDQSATESRLKTIITGPQPKKETYELLVRGTEFQVQVWRALLSIPRGETRSYAEIASQIERPRAVRAVGTAVGANPIAWIIPCHRVLRSDGGLGGYRWGVDIKKACLQRELQAKL